MIFQFELYNLSEYCKYYQMTICYFLIGIKSGVNSLGQSVDIVVRIGFCCRLIK